MRQSVRRAPSLLVLAALALSLLSLACASTRPAAPPPPPPIVGSWNLVIETPIGVQEPMFTVTGDAMALTGTLSSPQGDTQVQDLAFADGAVTFAMDIDAGGQQLHLEFSGTVDGDSMSGAFASDFGDMPVTGTRAP